MQTVIIRSHFIIHTIHLLMVFLLFVYFSKPKNKTLPKTQNIIDKGNNTGRLKNATQISKAIKHQKPRNSTKQTKHYSERERERESQNGEPKDGNGLNILGPERVLAAHPGGLGPGHSGRAVPAGWGSSQPSPPDSAALSAGKWVSSWDYSLLWPRCSQGVGLVFSPDSLAQTRNF
jgi:hypothetical protein